MSTTLTYHCLNCAAPLTFNPETGKFACEYCLSSFTEAELAAKEEAARKRAKEATKRAEKQAANKDKNDAEFAEHMLSYHCPSCGAEIVADDTTAADFCYYCHNPVVLSGKLVGEFAPDRVIPFKYDKDAAIEKLFAFARKKWFLPKDFFDKKRVESIRGVYYPFFVTDADTTGSLNASGTKIAVWRQGNYEYTKTSKFDIYRRGNIHFEDIVTSALSDGEKDMLEGILPYPSDAFIPFSMTYLSGFLAKKRNLEQTQIEGEVNGKMRGYTQTLLKNTAIGYNTFIVKSCDTIVHKSHWEYSLMPIWILTYKRKEKIYTYAMNGNTGKIYGELPISFPKLGILFGTLTTFLSILFFIIGGLL